ncbi:MAG: hypothetical protein IPP97_16540 [Candidatus Obscuribacter sp.]|nr:hypothetical protein [Candidatus Obscuribacter sp.]
MQLAANLRKSYCLTIAVALVAMLIYYGPALFGRREFFASDHTLYFEPFARFIGDCLRRGELPLWNPLCYCGMPQVANPSPGLFYFPTALYALMHYGQALSLTMMLSHLVACTAGFLLATRFSKSGFVAAFLGLALGFNGYMFTLSSNYTLSATAAWGFLSLYLVLRLGDKSISQNARLLTFSALTFCLHWMLMAGRPEVYVPAFATIGIVSLYPLLSIRSAGKSGDKSGDKSGAKAALATVAISTASMILAVVLSSMSMLPTFEWTRLSPRSTGMSVATSFIWSANWYDFLCLYAPQPLGDLQSPLNKFLNLVCSRKGYYVFLPSAYLGPVVLIFALLGLNARAYKSRYFVIAGLVCASICALGGNTIISPFVVQKLSFLTVLRYPVKLMIFVDLFICLLAAYGVTTVLAGTASKRYLKWLSIIFGSAALILGLVYLLRTTFAGQTFSYTIPFRWEVHFYSAAFYERLMRSLFFTTLGATMLALFLFFRDKYSDSTLKSLLFGALIGSLIAPNIMMPPRTVRPGYYHETALAKKLTTLSEAVSTQKIKERYVSLYFDPLKVPKNYSVGPGSKPGEPYMQFCRELLLPMTNVSSNYPVTFGYESSETKHYRESFFATIHKSSLDIKGADDLELYRFCRLSATRFAGTVSNGKKGLVSILNPEYFTLKEEIKDYNLRLYDVKEPTPRLYVASRAKIVDSEKAIDTWIKSRPSKGAKVSMADNTAGYHDLIETKPDIGSPFEDSRLLFLDPEATQQKERLDMKNVQDKLDGTALPAVPEFKKGEVVEGSGKCEFLHEATGSVSISVNMAKAGFLVLCDRFYPGWQVQIDGLPGTICRANGFMRAVYLRPGAHLVQYQYRPRSLFAGFYLALSALIINLIIVFWGARTWLWSIILYLSNGKWPESDNGCKEVGA